MALPEIDYFEGCDTDAHAQALYVASSATQLQSYSEGTIKTQGSYSLKGVATNASLNKTLSRTLTVNLDLSGKNTLKYDIRSTRTGSNIKLEIRNNEGAIDIGSAATDRASTTPSSYTMLDATNLANATGLLTSFEVWYNSTGAGVKIGTFSGSGTTWTNRDYVLFGGNGAVTSGSKQTYTGDTCDVTSGDTIGEYTASGWMDLDLSGGQCYYLAADAFGQGAQSYSDYGANQRLFSMYATGLASTTSTHTANISGANAFETQTWNISGITDAHKNNIDKIIITIVNADADNTFYLDNFLNYLITSTPQILVTI